MPSPTHREPENTVADRAFVGRTEELELFETSVTTPQSKDGYRILNYYGIGGMGKSGLCA